MGKKNKPDSRGYVYSTDSSFKFDEVEEQLETPSPGEQQLLVRIETKHRAGKAVTLVEGYKGKEEDAEQLSKKLKNICGTGGSYKDGEILIQGDQRDKVVQFLLKNGYNKTRKR
jgi:translation initiation factor 1